MNSGTMIKMNHQSNTGRVILLGIVGTIINLLGSYIAGRFGIVLYLDSIGTMIAAILGGALPGIVVGFITNIIKSISDPASIYYGTLNVLIAVCASFFAKRRLLNKPLGIISFVLCLTLIGGAMGSVLTWFLYGFASEGITAPFALKLYQSNDLSMEAAQFISDVSIDFLDKVVSTAIVLTIVNLLPRDIRRKFRLDWWHQTPLTDEARRQAKQTKFRSVSLRTKILIVITAALLIVAAAGTTIGFIIYRTTSVEEHKSLGAGVSSLAASIIDPDKVDEYIELGENAPGYIETEQALSGIRNSSPDIEYIYVYKIEPDGCHVIFDLDTDGLPGANAGDIVPFDESFPFVDELLAGQEIDPIITNDTYGWLLTSYTPVYNEQGECVCYAAADIMMSRLEFNGYSFLAKQISLFLGFFILILSVGLWLAEYNMILPMNTMALAAGAFAYDSEEARGDNVEHIRNLKISTGDEIENLYNAFTKTTEDSMQYVEDINLKTEQITQMQSGLIMVLADMVENRDKDTGDHIKKTAAYCKVVLEGLKAKGYYTEYLTDEFIQDVVDSAPLHDIGKIAVSDVILNKPARLTDEEFEIMKTHTTAGGEIITKAMATVQATSGYLSEAKNLALYHHEKWNGKGYPMGLKGNDIPLSARVMAVADVFDALVSRRCYKEPFSFEKAMDIIKEGSGEHFDPKMVEVFVEAEAEVRRIAEEFSE